MTLAAMQRQLSGIYDAPTPLAIADFLTTDRDLLAVNCHVDEQLLVARDDDTLLLSLFVDATVLQRLAAADPVQRLHSGNIADYLTALEGVSHFNYLVFHAAHDRMVSRLELELQAEIDKYVSSLWLLRAQFADHFPLELRALLFSSQLRIDARLTADEQRLYREASRCAARYCQLIEQQLSGQSAASSDQCLKHLRRFYRWPMARKLDFISRLS